MATRMQQRRGTAAEWTSINPVLAGGEIGYESDTGRFKMGDGTNNWENLYTYGSIDSILDAAPETLNTLNELAAAINDDPSFYTNVGLAVSTAKTEAISEAGTYADLLIGDGTVDGTSGNTVTARIQSAISDLIGGAPGALDTLNELAAALGDDSDYAATITQIVSDIQQSVIDATTSLNEGIALARTDLAADIDSEIADEVTNRDSAITAAVDLETTARDLAIAANSSDTLDAYTLAVAAETTAREAAITDLGTTITTAYQAYADTAESDAIATSSTDASSKADDAQSAAELTASTALTSHNDATTSVHGIADTSVLATNTDVSTAQTNAESYADSLSGNYDAAGLASTAQNAAESTAALALAAHNGETTSVHGITDTSKLVLTEAASQTITGDFIVTGDLTVSGTTTTIDTANFETTDPLIALGEGNVTNAVDLGFVSTFNDGVQQITGFARDASSDTWKLFKGVTDVPTTTINFAQGSLDDLSVKDLSAAVVNAASVVFADGTTQTVAAVPSLTVFSEKTASYTLDTIDHKDNLVEVNSGSATTFTIPTNASLAWPVGASMDILQTGSGQVTISPASGVTLNFTPGNKLRTQWSSATILKRSADSWVVYGDLTA
jgi:hypothetical protein